jgi:hypothetical protein
MKRTLALLLLVGCGGAELPAPSAAPTAVTPNPPTAPLSTPDAGTPDAGQPDPPPDPPPPSFTTVQATLTFDDGTVVPVSFNLDRQPDALTLQGFFNGFFLADVFPLGESCLDSFWINPSGPDSYRLHLPQPLMCQGPCPLTLETLWVSYGGSQVAGRGTGSVVCSSGSRQWTVSFP